MAWFALAGRKAIPRLHAEFRDFKRSEHVPRSSAGIQTCVVVYRRASRVPRSQNRENRPTGAGEKRANVLKLCIRYLVVLIARPIVEYYGGAWSSEPTMDPRKNVFPHVYTPYLVPITVLHSPVERHGGARARTTRTRTESPTLSPAASYKYSTRQQLKDCKS